MGLQKQPQASLPGPLLGFLYEIKNRKRENGFYLFRAPIHHKLLSNASFLMFLGARIPFLRLKTNFVNLQFF